jgi:hypothetical protein
MGCLCPLCAMFWHSKSSFERTVRARLDARLESYRLHNDATMQKLRDKHNRLLLEFDAHVLGEFERMYADELVDLKARFVSEIESFLSQCALDYEDRMAKFVPHEREPSDSAVSLVVDSQDRLVLVLRS